MTKLCNKCNITKPTIEFYKTSSNKDGLNSRCKSCIDVQNKTYQIKNKNEIAQNQRKYYQDNVQSIAEYKKEWFQNNRDINKEKQYYLDNIETIKEYKKSHQELYKSKRNKDLKFRRDNDPLYKLECGVRSLIRQYIKQMGYKKNSKTAVILGCSYDDFKVHIENQFTEGMSWDNSGKWHYDHIIPISSAKSEQEVIELNHYTNFQPLWAEDNMQKGNKLNWTKI